MRLYKLELLKLTGRRFTQIMTGLLLAMLVLQLWVESTQAVAWKAENDFGQLIGYVRFIDLLQYYVLYGMIWLTAVLTPFYCEDRQSRTDVLIMTSAKGKISDFAARLAVAFTLAVAAIILALGAAYWGCYVLYGYPGGNASAREIYFWIDETTSAMLDGSIYAFIRYYLILVLCAVLMLTGIIVWVSAVSSKTVHSLIAASGIFWFPVLLESGLNPRGIGFLLVTGQPIYLVVVRYLCENWSLYGQHIFLALLVAAVGSICGGRLWCLPHRQ